MPIGIGEPQTNYLSPTPLDPFGKQNAGASDVPDAVNPLDSQINREQLTQIESWWAEKIDLHAENRREQLIDCDFYDRDQLSPADRAALEARNQAPIILDLVHPICDWIIGTECRTRVDWAVHPRLPQDVDAALAKEKVMKFISDTSSAEFERSKAFKDKIKCGVGWTREWVNTDKRKGPPLYVGHVPWKAVRWDPYSRRDDLKDCRSIDIEHYLDLDYACAMWPERYDYLRAAQFGMLDPQLELVVDDLVVPSLFIGSRAHSVSGVYSSSRMRGNRARVRIIETEYRRPMVENRIKALVDGYDEIVGLMYDEKDSAMADLIDRQRVTVEQTMSDQMWLAIWHPGFLLRHMPSPYKHNEFSLTPDWAWRRHRDGMPYGVIRGLRDPQDEYNKRRSKALFAMSVNRVIYEEDALANGMDEDDLLDEVAKPNGQIKVAKGALSGNKIRIDNQLDVGQAHIGLMEQLRTHMFEGSGVTRENLGLQSAQISGRAILAKQQQGSVATAELFDNMRMSMQMSGRKLLSLIEQYMSLPMQIRVTGDAGALEWLAINQPFNDPSTGKVFWQNDITQSEADFVIDQQDYRETVRMAMAEMLMDTIAKMPPELGIKLLDLAVELTDIPNRDEIVARIRQMNGTTPPDPQAQAQAQAQQQQQAQQAEENRQSALAAQSAKTAKDTAAAAKMNAETQNIGVDTKQQALNTAGMLQSMLPLAPAADRLAALPPLVAPPQLPKPVLGPPPQANGYPTL